MVGYLPRAPHVDTATAPCRHHVGGPALGTDQQPGGGPRRFGQAAPQVMRLVDHGSGVDERVERCLRGPEGDPGSARGGEHDRTDVAEPVDGAEHCLERRGVGQHGDTRPVEAELHGVDVAAEHLQPGTELGTHDAS